MNDRLDDEMFRLLMEELRMIRQRLDSHIDDEDRVMQQIRADIHRVKEELVAHKGKIGAISASIAVVVTTFLSWLWGSFSR